MKNKSIINTFAANKTFLPAIYCFTISYLPKCQKADAMCPSLPLVAYDKYCRPSGSTENTLKQYTKMPVFFKRAIKTVKVAMEKQNRKTNRQVN